VVTEGRVAVVRIPASYYRYRFRLGGGLLWAVAKLMPGFTLKTGHVHSRCYHYNHNASSRSL
jgi:hypothetical protein